MKRNQNKHKIRKSAVAIMTALSVLMGSACFVMADEPTPAPTTITTPAETPAPVTPAETPAKLPSLSDLLDKELPKLPDDFKPAPVVPGAKEEQLKDQIEKAPDEIIISQLKKKHDNDDSLSREDRIAVESTVDKMTKMPLLDEMEAAMSEMDTAEEMSAYYEKAAADREAALDAYFAMSEELRKEIPLALVHELQAEMADAWQGKVMEEVEEVVTPATLAATALPTFKSGMTQTWDKAPDDLHVFVHGKALEYYQRSPHKYGTGDSGYTPATYMLFDASEAGSYTTNGTAYNPENSDYVVVYCCDEVVSVDPVSYYQRKNLEDVTGREETAYYDEDEARHIRGIVTNSYPFVSANTMRETLDQSDGTDDNYFTVGNKSYHISEIEEAELLTATQFAVWHFANGDDFKYSKSSPTDATAAYSVLSTRYDFVKEGSVYKTAHDDLETRIGAIYKYLTEEVSATEPGNSQIVITKVELSTPYPIVQKNPNGTYTATLTVTLGGTLGANGSGTMTLTKNDETTAFKTVDLKEVLGTNGKTYTMKLELDQGDVIHVAVSGTQDLPRGVYFYEPLPNEEGQNVKDTAQSFVGVASGNTPFEANSQVTFDDPGVELQIVKTVKDYDGNVSPMSGVTFKLSYDDANDLFDFSDYTYQTDANGHIDLAGLNGTGTYTLEEVEPTYFKDVMPIRFTVENDKIVFEDYANADGKPVVSLNSADGNNPAKVEVENRRFDRGSTEIKALKKLNNKPLDADTEEEFEFTLTEVNGATREPIADSPYTQTVTNLNDNDGNVAQVLFELKNLDEVKTHWFELAEVDLGEKYYTYDDTVYTIKVEVTAENEAFVPNVTVTYYKDGEEVTADEVVFDNYWKKKKDDNITVTAKKVWAVASDVEIPESVTVELVNEKGNASAGTRVLSEENGWKASWTVDEDETWVVKEVNVPEGFKVSYSGDQEDGFIVTNSGGDSGTNSGDTSAKVTKKWSGDSEEDRPDSIKVQLYRDGEAYGDVVTLSEADGWSYDWGELDENHEWTVEEIDVPSGYVSKVEGSVEDGFTITNSVSDDDDEEENKNDDGDDDDGDVLGIDDENVPKGDMVLADEEEVLAAETGDNNHIIAAGAAMAAALIGIILLRRKKTN